MFSNSQSTDPNCLFNYINSSSESFNEREVSGCTGTPSLVQGAHSVMQQPQPVTHTFMQRDSQASTCAGPSGLAPLMEMSVMEGEEDALPVPHMATFVWTFEFVLLHFISPYNTTIKFRRKFIHTKSDEIINSFELLTLTCQLSRILLLWKKEFWIYVARIFPGFIGDHNFAFDCKLVSSIPSETLRVFSCHHGPREKFILDRNFLSTTKSDCNVI